MELKSIADYYDQTLVHYKQHWHLKSSNALHYGLWLNNTKNLKQALANTNKKIAELGLVKSSMSILDAGCGVGGTATYLSKNYGCKTTGITLSIKQLIEAKLLAYKLELTDLVSFELKNYEQTEYPDASFDLIYGIESICHSTKKLNFLKEAYRLLKPNGKLIVLDFFQKKENLINDDLNLMNNWLNSWAIKSLETTHKFKQNLRTTGFSEIKTENLTSQIIPSSKKLYKAAFIGFLPSKLYSLYKPKVSPYAKNHYKSGYYQYLALKKSLWSYNLLYAEK